MFLLSKLLPKFVKRKYDEEGKMPCLGEKPRNYQFRVLLLDDSDITVNIKTNYKGHVVMERVFEHLNLFERDYFGLRYLDATNQTHWLDSSKSIGAQFKTGSQHTLYFGVKFYAADPCKLHEEITRYQMFLQIKRDMLQGRLPVSFEVGAELCAFAVQSELGDYDPKRHSAGYVSEFRFLPNQTEDLETRVMHIHRQLAGQVPSVAEYKFLDKVKWLEMYGVDLHPAQGEGNIEYFVGLTPIGIVIYKNKSKVGSYFWPRISKITFKDKSFMIRVKDKNSDENTYAFECTTKQACKHLWKCSVEHHAFFRLSLVQNSFSSVGKVFSMGSKHRYSGRTEKQISTESLNRPQPKVNRTPSKRQQRRLSTESLHNGAQYYADENHVDGPITTVVTPEPVKTPSGHRKDFGSEADSPRSTRSAPWQTMKGGMYTSGRDSPLSVRSEKMMFPNQRRAHSASDGEQSYYKKRRSRRPESDYDSDASQRRHRRKHRDRDGGASSGTESEPGYRHRRHHSRRSEHNNNYSENQYREREGRRTRDNYGNYGNPEGGEMRTNGSMSSMPGSEASHQSRRRRRRRSRSPGKRPPEELAQHFRYIEAQPGLTDDQLRDIPYTVVETDNPFSKSPHERRRHRSSKRRSHGENLEKTGEHVPNEEAPPPYSSDPYGNRHSYPNLQHHHRQHDPYRSGSEISEMVQPPASAYRNQAHTAPIVKTKPSGGQQYQNVNSSFSHAPASLPARMPMRQDASFSHNDPSAPHNIKHPKEDSGLGFDQQDFNSSSMSGSHNSQNQSINEGHPGNNYPPSQSHLTGQSYQHPPNYHPPQNYHPPPSYQSPKNYQSVPQTQGYSYNVSRAKYQPQGKPESQQPHNSEQPPRIPPYPSPSAYTNHSNVRPNQQSEPGFYTSPHPPQSSAAPPGRGTNKSSYANHLTHHPVLSPGNKDHISQAMNSTGTNRDLMTEL